MVLLHLTDFFRGSVIEKVQLQGLEHVLQFTAVDGKIYMRSYRLSLKMTKILLSCDVINRFRRFKQQRHMVFNGLVKVVKEQHLAN